MTHLNSNSFTVAAMTANGTTANGGQEGEKVAPPPEKGSWTIGLINSRWRFILLAKASFISFFPSAFHFCQFQVQVSLSRNIWVQDQCQWKGNEEETGILEDKIMNLYSSTA